MTGNERAAVFYSRLSLEQRLCEIAEYREERDGRAEEGADSRIDAEIEKPESEGARRGGHDQTTGESLARFLRTDAWTQGGFAESTTDQILPGIAEPGC